MPQSASRRRFRIALAQVNPLVGDVHGNTALVLDRATAALQECQADMVVFPELVLTGYPPEDLLLRPGLDRRIEQALTHLCEAALPLILVVGYPGREAGKLYNMLAVIEGGKILGCYRKQRLPNYQVFDEKRYFKRGRGPLVLPIGGMQVAFSICEDLWKDKVMLQAAASGANLRNRQSHTKTAGQWAGATLYVRTNSGGSAAEYVLNGDTSA